jgi:hypothetical protein
MNIEIKYQYYEDETHITLDWYCFIIKAELTPEIEGICKDEDIITIIYKVITYGCRDVIKSRFYSDQMKTYIFLGTCISYIKEWVHVEQRLTYIT